MINLGIETVTSALQIIRNQVEKLDEQAASRPHYYGTLPPAEATQVETEATQIDKLRVVTGDLIDLWLFEGSKGLKFLQESRAYKLTDPYLHYIEKYESIKDSSIVQKTIPQVYHRVVLLVDETTKRVSFMIKVIRDRQVELIDYIQRTYSNVVVFVKDNWLRLDFNKDGSVSVDDVRKRLSELYEFLKSYDYIEATTRIKSTVYEEAKRYMRVERQSVSVADDINITGEKNEGSIQEPEQKVANAPTETKTPEVTETVP